MNKYLQQIDKLILKIPVQIRDLIVKVFFMILAIAALIAIIYGIRKGIENAEPGGAKLFQKNEDFFYLEKIREENRKKNKIIEDIEVYKDLFEARDERIHPTFKSLGKDTDDRLIGDREEFLKEPDELRRKQHEFLMEDDNSLEYEKPLPDSNSERKLNQTPFIENDKNMDNRQRQSGQEPVEIQNSETEKSPRESKPEMEFIE
jgi:hypothetical protein